MYRRTANHGRRMSRPSPSPPCSRSTKISASTCISRISAPPSLWLFSAASKPRVPTASAETCPHYLFFTEEDLARVGPYAKINPPLRKAADQAALWDALSDGTVMAITTDHSPFTVEEKERARTDIWATPPGAPGVEELLLGVMHEALSGRISINKAIDLVATNGARRFGVYPERGHIGIGAAADLVVYDPNDETTISSDMLFQQSARLRQALRWYDFQRQGQSHHRQRQDRLC